MKGGFSVTVYSQGGYYEIEKIGRELRGLEDSAIDSGITQGGLSVSGPWSSYEAFAAVIDRFPSATFKSGPSIHQHLPIRLSSE